MKSKEVLVNREGRQIVCLIERDEEGSEGLVFVIHGLGGFKEQFHIRSIAESFVEAGFTTVSIDMTNGVGESDGLYKNANLSWFIKDIEDTLRWAEKQEWYYEPYYLAGHSLGALAAAEYAAAHPTQVKGLIAVSSVISGKLSMETTPDKPSKKQHEEGFWLRTSRSNPAQSLVLDWHQFKHDIMKYDILKKAKKLTMPVLLVVGDKDQGTPPMHQELFYEALKGKKELHIIHGAGHNLEFSRDLQTLRKIIAHWLSVKEGRHSIHKWLLS